MIIVKKTVCVVFGGASSEYEISLMSSSSILRNLDTEKFDILTLGITKDGRWLLYSGGIDAIEDGTWVEHPENRTAFLSPDRSTAGLVVLEPDGTCSIRKIDVVFPVLHGKKRRGRHDSGPVPALRHPVCRLRHARFRPVHG